MLYNISYYLTIPFRCTYIANKNITMKHKEFIEDLDALCRQYWGSKFTIESVDLDHHHLFNRVIYLRLQDETKQPPPAVDMQGMAKKILRQP